MPEEICYVIGRRSCDKKGFMADDALRKQRSRRPGVQRGTGTGGGAEEGRRCLTSQNLAWSGCGRSLDKRREQWRQQGRRRKKRSNVFFFCMFAIKMSGLDLK